MPDILFLIKVSRPRFWIYIFGPYLIGLVAGISDRAEFLSPIYMLVGLYFLFPANLLIYGVNDIFDYETDKLNAKKTEYEALVTPEKRKGLVIAIIVTNIPFLAVFSLSVSAASIAAIGFLLLSIFYSAPPIRAKATPFLDSAFNVLYIMPGVLSYSLTSGVLPAPAVIFAGGLWTAAMHAFSAIPDIAADREADLSTIATTLGPTGTQIFCIAAYVVSAVLAFPYLGTFSIIAGGVFVSMMLASLFSAGRIDVFRIYRLFPTVNAAVGFAIFWYIALPKFL